MTEDRFEELMKRHMGVLAENFRKETRAIAEGTDMVYQELVRFRSETNERFDKLENRITHVDVKLSEKIDSVDKKLSEKIDNVDKKLSEKIDSVDKKLSKKIDSVDKKLSKKIDNVDKKLSEKIDSNSKAIEVLSTKVDSNHKEVLAAIKFSYAELDTRITVMENRQKDFESRLIKLEGAQTH